jgi:hypothetical protein
MQKTASKLRRMENRSQRIHKGLPLTREEVNKKPVRLREHYPEPQRQIPQKGLSWTPPQQQRGTSRKCNP